MKKLLFLYLSLFSLMTICHASSTNNEINDNYTNSLGVVITAENYNRLLQLIDKNKIEYLSENEYEYLVENYNEIENIDYKLIKTVYYYDSIGTPFIIENKEVESIDSTSGNRSSCTPNAYIDCEETNYKSMMMTVGNSDYGKKFFIRNTWKNTPQYKSFDVIGFRWNNTISINYYQGDQFTNGNTSHVVYKSNQGYDHFKFSSYGIGLSQNLVDSATEIENELAVWLNCNSSGHVYSTYQHAQANVSLATSKSYTFSSTGMGGVFAFTGNAVGKYDNTPGMDLSYTC